MVKVSPELTFEITLPDRSFLPRISIVDQIVDFQSSTGIEDVYLGSWGSLKRG